MAAWAAWSMAVGVVSGPDEVTGGPLATSGRWGAAAEGVAGGAGVGGEVGKADEGGGADGGTAVAAVAERYFELLCQGRLDEVSRVFWSEDVVMRWACREAVRGRARVIADVGQHMAAAVPEHVEFERPMLGPGGFTMRVWTVNRLRGSGHLFRAERLWFQGVRAGKVHVMQEFLGGVSLLWPVDGGGEGLEERVTVNGTEYRTQALSVPQSIEWIAMHGL